MPQEIVRPRPMSPEEMLTFGSSWNLWRIWWMSVPNNPLITFNGLLKDEGHGTCSKQEYIGWTLHTITTIDISIRLILCNLSLSLYIYILFPTLFRNLYDKLHDVFAKTCQENIRETQIACICRRFLVVGREIRRRSKGARSFPTTC